MHLKIATLEMHFKIAPSKNTFQNCCLSSIVIEGIKTLLFFLQKPSKNKKT